MNKYFQWLIDNKRVLSISLIERELSMPAGTLDKFVNNKRGLDPQWHERVIGWVKQMVSI